MYFVILNWTRAYYYNNCSTKVIVFLFLNAYALQISDLIVLYMLQYQLVYNLFITFCSRSLFSTLSFFMCFAWLKEQRTTKYLQPFFRVFLRIIFTVFPTVSLPALHFVVRCYCCLLLLSLFAYLFMRIHMTRCCACVCGCVRTICHM